jgi:hypothetical protein
MCFVVSSVTGIVEPKGKKRKLSSEETNVGDQAEEGSGDKDEEEEDDGKLYPGIALWMAYSVPDCLVGKVQNNIMQMIQACGLSPIQCKVTVFTLTVCYVRRV